MPEGNIIHKIEERLLKMKSGIPLNKVQIVAAVIVTVITLLRAGYIIFGDEIDKEYDTSTSYDLSDAQSVPCEEIYQTFSSKQNRLYRIELALSNINNNEAGTILLQIRSKNDVIYQTNLSLSDFKNNEWRKIFVNAEIKPDVTYQIHISANDDCNQIPDVFVVTHSYAPEIISSSASNSTLDGQIAINYGYLKAPGIREKISEISLWIILWLLVFSIIKYFPIIRKFFTSILRKRMQSVNPTILCPIVQVMLALCIISYSGIEFQKSTKIIIYGISFISAVHIEKKIPYIKALADATWKKAVLFFLYAYAAFALVGQRIFIYPLTVKLMPVGFFIYILTFLWSISVMNCFLYYLGFAVKHCFAEAKMRSWQFFILCAVILIGPAFFNLFAYNPGITSPDSYFCMITQAQHLHGSGDWHPAFYCMILRAIENVWNSTYAVIAVQYLFWLYVCMEFLLYLRKKRINEIVLICVAIFLGFNAGNYIQLNTIWKDIPYTLSIFWAVILLAKLAIDYDEYKKKWYLYFELLVSFVGISLFRKNGIVSYIIIAAFFIIIFRRNLKVWVTAALSVLMIFMIKGPVYSYFEIQPVQSGMYIGLSQDILGAYYSGGEVSEDTLKMINVMTGNNDAEYTYKPTWAYQTYDLDVPGKEFISNYIHTFVKNPVVMMRAIIDREDAVWDIFAGQDSVLGCVNYTGTEDGQDQWNHYYPARAYVSIYDRIHPINTYIASSQWLSAIEWRCGLFVVLGFMSIVYLAISGGMKKTSILLAPIIGHILSLVLSTGWSDFRYFWPLNLMNLAILLFSIIVLRNRSKTKVHEGGIK